MMSTSTLTAALLLIISFTPSHGNNNGTVCILAPPGSTAGQLQQLQQQLEQQVLAGQDPLAPLIPGIPPIFRSDDPRYNILPPNPLNRQPGSNQRNFFDQPLNTVSDQNRTGKPNFWDQPINRTSSGSRNRFNDNQSPDSGYQSDDPAMQQQHIPFDPLQQQPQRPQYDRSGFRREPLHPSYNPNDGSQKRVPSLVPSDGNQRPGATNDAERRSSPDPWSRFTTVAPINRREPTPQSSFFDPTRRPKTGNQGRDPTTTRKPFYSKNNAYGTGTGAGGSNKNPAFNPGGRNPQTPGLTKEVTTRSPGKESFSSNPQPVDVVPGPVEPNAQAVPEYAYIKQPISKVLDQPDLELEGKPVKFGILKDALDRVGLLELMAQASPVTVFAPTDEAFLQLEPEILTRMQQNPNFLRNTMLRHIVNFDMPPDTLRNNIIVPSYSGEPLIVSVIGKLMLVKGTPIIAATNTQNGVIYVINKVMTEETTSATVVEELANMPDASIFYQYISRSTQIRRLQGQGPFTILAPNNTAFEKLPAATRQALDYNPIVLEKLLSFHIVEGAVFRKELETSDSIGGSGGNSLGSGPGRVEPLKLRSAPDGSITVNDVAVVQTADIATGNGVVHVINSVLIPAELVATFRQLEARSLFHPSTRQPLTTTASNRNSQLQRDQPSVRPSFGFSPTPQQPQQRQQQQPRRDRSFDRNANFAVRTGTANNLNNPLAEASAAEAASAPRSKDDEPAARFYKWIKKSGFFDVLNNTGNNYTVILPIDRAVNRLPLKYQQSLETNSRQLESLLMYHIIPGVVNMSRLKDEDTIPTVSGKDVRFNRIANSSSNSTTGTRNPPSAANETTSLPNVTFSGASLVGSESVSDGKIKFLLVDRVMYPPQGNLFDVISNSPILKSLANLIKVAGLEAGLSDTGPFTLFAPSDEAFQKLPLESIDYLSHDPQSSRAFLLRHIIRPVLFTSSIPIGNSTIIESTTGERLQIVREKDVVKVDGVGIRYADITATNGVIHVIDHVL